MAIYFISVAVVAIVVIIHYEFLHQFTRLMPHLRMRHRFRIVLGVFAALAAHALEVTIFAIAFQHFHHHPRWGELTGDFDGSLRDAIYFSFTSYTTLGVGDVEPVGALRFLTGFESLTGLVLITWTASFLYLEMTRYWDSR